MKTALTLLFAAFLALAAAPASAVIIVAGTDSGQIGSLGTSGSFPYTLQGGGNALVFGVYADNAITYSNPQYGGAAADAVITDGRVGLFYFENPAASGNITFDVDLTVADAGYFLYELSSVDTSMSAITSIDTSITTTADSQFVINYAGMNFGDGTGTTPAAGSIITTSSVYDIDGGGGGGALAHGTGFAGLAGVQTLGWDRMNGNDSGDVAIALFDAPGGPTPWNVNGGGSYNAGANWLGGNVPTDSPFFGPAHATAATATVTLDSPVSLSSMTISNANPYEIAGPSTLTLTGGANLLVGEGTHEISAVIAGSAGLTKSGGANLVLSGANTYTGGTTVAGGQLQLASAGAAPGNMSLAAAGTLAFVAGHDGAFSGNISGAGGVLLDASLTSETVTFSGAKTYTGVTQISGGTLSIGNGGALGAGNSTPETGTTVSENGSQNNGKLALTGGVTVANELLTLFPRRGAGVADLVHLTSSGNNTWGGNIKGGTNGDNYNIESTSGTLTLSGTISAPDDDTGVRNYVFTAAAGAAINVTGDIIDSPTDASGAPSGANLENNVNVIKRGAGTLRFSNGSNLNNDFWYGSVDGPGTVIEAGTLEVVGTANDGELRADVQVNAGATYKVDVGFNKYNLLPLSPYEVALSGAGTVIANTLGVYESNTLSPGDSIGTLKVTGDVDLFYFDADDTTVSNTGSLNFELGDDASIKSVDNTENDLISVSGDLQIGAGAGGSESIGGSQFVVNAAIADGVFDTSTNYTLFDANSLTLGPGVSASNFQVNFTDSLGNVITGSRYTASVVLDTVANEVQLDVDGTPVSLTWTGALGTAWDTNTTANWSGADTLFRSLDEVTFDDTAGENDTVDISSGDVIPSQVNFHSATGNTYTVTGANGISGATPINVTGDVTVALQNPNVLQGTIDVGPNARLEIGGGSDVQGDITGTGTLAYSVGGATLVSGISFLGPIELDTAVFIQDDNALGATSTGTTINAGGNLWFNFVDLTVSEPLTLNGGQVNVTGDMPQVVLTGQITADAAGGSFTVGPNHGDNALRVTGDITGTASGQVTASIGAGSVMTVTGNITNNGALIKQGGGTLALGSGVSIASAEIAVDGGTLDATALASVPLSGGQTLSGSFGTLDGNVVAASGSTVRVGGDGLEVGTVYQYTDATYGAGGNTTLAADGSEYTPPGGSSWLERAFGNENTILESQVGAPNPNGAPVLKTTVDGLTPSQTYNVLLHYWVDTSQWRILAGDSATLSQVDDLYDRDNGVDLGPLNFDTAVVKTEGNRTMFGAPLSLTANGAGEIEVFFDDAEGSGNTRTWYDGVSVEVVDVSPETFTISGDLALQSGATLSLDLASPGVNDRLIVGGALSVADGFSLDVAVATGVDSSSFGEGDSWDLIDFASATGAFSQGDFNLPSLSGGLLWDTSSLLTDGVLSIVAGIAADFGDFNGDGVVDAIDYAVWREAMEDPSAGAAGSESVLLMGNGNGDGFVTAADFSTWLNSFGADYGGSPPPSAPEPGSLLLILTAASFLANRRTRTTRV